MSGHKRKPIIKFKQHITPDFHVENKYLLHPPTHTHENLNAVQGGSYQLNAKQNIVIKTDVNSYK